MLLGVNGGLISAGEYRLAIAMRAKVGLIRDSGGSADDIFCDELWSQMVTSLYPTINDIQAFINMRLCSERNPRPYLGPFERF